jgi:hypothetical protein
MQESHQYRRKAFPLDVLVNPCNFPENAALCPGLCSGGLESAGATITLSIPTPAAL